MKEARDFLEECESLSALIAPLTPQELLQPTLFKGWTIADIIAHLHLWNIAADLTAFDPKAFQSFAITAMTSFAQKRADEQNSHIALQNAYFAGQSPADIRAAWTAFYPKLAARFAKADPDARAAWLGPDMSLRSCIIARQMEHWAHAQAIFDRLGHTRVNTDRLKNIAHIGVTTYGWSFKVNQQTPPLPKPYVRLVAPSGALWEWNDPQDDNRVEGLAVEFCQVVTQCRNIEDTALRLTGSSAARWMALAQCFAGGAEAPPPKGTRFTS